MDNNTTKWKRWSEQVQSINLSSLFWSFIGRRRGENSNKKQIQGDESIGLIEAKNFLTELSTLILIYPLGYF